MPKRSSSGITPEVTRLNVQVSDQPALQRLITCLAADNALYDEAIFLVKLWDVKFHLLQVMDPDSVPAFLEKASADIEHILALRLKIKYAGISELTLKLASREWQAQYREISQRQVAEPNLVQRISQNPYLVSAEELQKLPGYWRGLQSDIENVNEVVQSCKDNLNEFATVCERIHANFGEPFKHAIALLINVEALEAALDQDSTSSDPYAAHQINKFAREVNNLKSHLQSTLNFTISDYLTNIGQASVVKRLTKYVDNYVFQYNQIVEAHKKSSLKPMVLERNQRQRDKVEPEDIIRGMPLKLDPGNAMSVAAQLERLYTTTLERWKTEFNGQLPHEASVMLEFIFTSLKSSLSGIRRIDRPVAKAMAMLAEIHQEVKTYNDTLALVEPKLHMLGFNQELQQKCITQFHALIQAKNQNIETITGASSMAGVNAASLAQLGFFVNRNAGHGCKFVHFDSIHIHFKVFMDSYAADLLALRGFIHTLSQAVDQILMSVGMMPPRQS